MTAVHGGGLRKRLRMKFGWRSGRLWSLGFGLLIAAAFPSLASAASCVSAPTNLVSWWSGDGSAVDFAGTNNGTLQGGATAAGTGMVGSAFTFDGTNSYVQVPDATSLKPTNLTIEAWVKFTSLNSAVSVAPAGEQYMVFKQNTRNGNFEGYYLGKTRISGQDHFTFQVSSSAGATIELDSVTSVATNTWYHVAAVRGPSTVQLYVNGTLEVQSSVSFAQDYGTLPVYFGTSGQTFWDGKLFGTLDEVSFYNRALTSNEVATVFAAGAAGKCKAPIVVTAPQSQTVNVGSNVLFSVSATGFGTLSYQWKFNGASVAGATTTSLTLTNVQTNSAGSYAVVVTNTLGTATSAVATLTILVPPSISAQPQSHSSECGSSTSFSVTAGGTAPLGYQWYFNGGAIAGATTTGLSLANVHSAQQGSYAVVVTNSAGTITSAPAAVLTVVDTTPPVVTMLGANPMTMECHAAFADPGATASDTCAGALAVATNSTVNANAVGTYTIKYVATDGSGNSATNTRTVNVVDTTPPIITLNGPNPMTNECHAAFADPGATANDVCAGALSVGANSTVNPNAVGIYTITYTTADPSGNAATNTRTVYVVDKTPPVITLNGSNPLTNECHASFTDPGATANDACAGSVGLNSSSTVNPNAVGTYSITYTATDPNGNSATNTRTVVVVDTTAPVITVNGPNPLTNECHAAFVDPGATASDGCAGSVGIITNSAVNPNAVGIYTIRYTATDPSGNSTTNTRTVYVIDTTPPVITLNGANPLTNECHAAFTDPGATANDSCAGGISVTTGGSVNPNSVGVYTIFYSATDPSGNSVTNSRIVYVVDRTPPIITLNGANPLTNECHAAFVDPGATASDLCAGGLAVMTNSTVNPNAVGNYTITYTATDPSGNSTTNTRTVYVIDTTPPVITLNGANPLTNECHAPFVDPGATASDACAGGLGVTATGSVNANAVGVYTINYTATDPSGNSATNTRTVYVVDTTGPVVTLNGANPLTNECHAAFTDPGATASDACAGSLGVVTNSTVNPNAVGVYTISYTATDPSGNSTTNTRTVYVLDRTPPVITLNGPNPLTNECHAAFTDPGAAASDACAGGLSVVAVSSVNPNAVGVYIISYTATDPSGNSATNTRTVYVVDTTAPVVTLNGANPMTNECHAVFTDPGATATDTCAGSLAVITNNTVNPNAVGVYTISYTATDPSGNSTTNARTVYVLDRTPPIITLNGPNPLTNECHAAFSDPGASASDACAGSLSVGAVSSVNPNAVGVYNISYAATDPSGNSATNTRTVYVVDTTKPSITSAITNFVLTANANCQAILPDLTTPGFIVAVDACSSVTVTQFPVAGTIYSLGTTNLVALTAVDSSGNASNRIVTVVFPGAPSILSQPTNMTVVVSNNVSLSVAACGLGQLRYQWQHASTNLPGATNSILTLTTVRTNDGGNYAVIIANNSGSITSQAAVLTVFPFGIITDPNLNALVMGLLGKTTCDVSALDLVALTNLYAPSAGITNLAGLSAATNLTTLYLGGNAITDLTPLQGLTGLTTLFVQNNLVTNLTPLAGLTNLTFLDVRWNPATNYQAVISGMTGLTDLYLGGNGLTNVAFLQNLSALRFLGMDHNAITDLSPLAGLANLMGMDIGYNSLADWTQPGTFTNLNNLYLSGNLLSNVTFLTNLTRLTSLVLCSNQLTAIPALGGLSSLSSLHLGGNRAITNYSALSTLVSVTNLWASGNAISNVSSFQSLSGLGYLNLDDNVIRDPSPLASLSHLTTLSAERNQITNAATLAGLTNISSVWLGGNFITNAGFLQNWTRLALVELDSNRITNGSPLSSLSQLNYLSLRGNLLTDGSPFAGLTNLLDLRLGQNAFGDASFAFGLTRLTYLGLDSDQISNLSPLAGLTGLGFLDLSTNQITDLTPLAGMTNLASLSLLQNHLTDVSLLAILPRLSSVDLRFNLLDLSTGSAARSSLQAMTTKCPPVSVQPAQPDLAPTQRTAPTIAVSTPLATLINGTWPLSANVTSVLSFLVSDNGPANQKMGVGAHSSNDPLIPNASLVPTLVSNQVGTLNITPNGTTPNSAFLTLSVTNDAGLSTNVTVSLTVLMPQTVTIPDLNLQSAVRSALGKASGNLTTLDMMSLIDLAAESRTITNLTGLEYATNLFTLDVLQNSLTDIHSITNLPRLDYVNVVWNLLDLSANSAANKAINTLSNRNVVVLYLPQRTAPVIAAASTWSIGPSRSSTFFFTVSDTVASSAQLKLGAVSSNAGLIPNANVVLARYIYDPYWTLTVTPITGATGSTIITLSATNEVGLASSWPVTVTVVPPIPLTGGPLDNWTSMSWQTSANAPWFVQTNYVHDGLPAAQSGAIGDGEESWLQTTVNGPGTLTFWQKVSSEAGFDFLEFYVNNLLQTNVMISGEVDWQQRSISLPAGTQLIRWEYSKDNSGKAGMDAAWLAEVSFTLSGLRLELPGPPANGYMLLILHGTVGNHYEIDASSNLFNWSSIVTLTNTATNTGGAMPYSDLLPPNAPVRYYRAKQLP